jgi:cytochrome c5
VDHKNHDQVFYRTFAMVLGALFGIFFICIFAARLIDTGEVYADEGAEARLIERIQPVGKVITDEAVLMKMAAATKVAREPYSGEQVMQKICAACHNAALLGAPKTGDKAAWDARLRAVGGFDALVTSAIKGKGSMPARGGDADLSDAEVRAAVELMIK